MNETIWDVAIVGGGTAGFTAGIYSCRAGLSTVLLEQTTPGGQIANVDCVENFPGFPEGISGPDLGPKLVDQSMQSGLDVRLGRANGVVSSDPYWIIETYDEPVVARSVIIATGSTLRKLGVFGEEEFFGKGLCDLRRAILSRSGRGSGRWRGLGIG